MVHRGGLLMSQTCVRQCRLGKDTCAFTCVPTPDARSGMTACKLLHAVCGCLTATRGHCPPG